MILDVPTRSSQTPSVTVCVSLNLDTANQIPILEGDIYAGLILSRSSGLPVLASLPIGSGRQLYRDIRDFSDIESSPELRRSQLDEVDDIGLHLFADIS